MKRTTIGVMAISVLVLLVLVPFGMGFFVQNKVKNQVFQWAEQESFVEVEWLSFKRGFWSSTADFMLIIKNSDAQSGHVVNQSWAHLLVRSRITHGPLLIGGGKIGPGVAVGWAMVDSQLLKAVDNGYPDKGGAYDGYFTLNANTRTLLKFTGGFTTKILGSQVAVEMPGHPQFRMEDVHVKFTADKNYEHQSADLTIPKLEVKKDNYQLSFEHTELTGDWEKTKYDFYQGNSEVNIKSMQALKDVQPVYNAKALHIATAQALNKDLLNVNVNLAFDESTFKGETYGPLKHKMALNNIRAAALQKLQQQLRMISHSSLPAEQQRMQVMMLLPLVPQLITQGASFEVKQFDLTVPMGQLSMEGYARIAKSHEQSSPGNMMRLLPKVTAQANLQLPTELVERLAVSALHKRLERQRLKAQASGTAPATQTDLSKEEITKMVKSRLQDWEARGFLVREKERYKISFTFKDGHFLVNGKSLETGNEIKVNANTNTSKMPQPSLPDLQMPMAAISQAAQT